MEGIGAAVGEVQPLLSQHWQVISQPKFNQIIGRYLMHKQQLKFGTVCLSD